MFDVITIGTGVRDVFLKSDAFKVVKDPVHLKKLGFPTGEAQCFALGGKIPVDAPVLSIGGGAANAGVTFGRQGFKTASLIKVGRDKNGEDVLRDLKNEDVSPLALFDDKNMTGYSVLLLSPDGERTILTHRGASSDLLKKEIPFGMLSAKFAYIVPGRIKFNAIRAIVDHFKDQGAIIAMDPSSTYIEMGLKKLKPILKHLAVFKMNREEASQLTGVDYDDEEGIFRVLDKATAGIAVMTDGPRGVTVSDGQNIFRAGVFKEKRVADRTGAGDAFGSGFMAGLIRASKDSKRFPKAIGKEGKQIRFSEDAIRYAIRLGSANATSVVEHVGAQKGTLSAKQFETQKRWKNLSISEK